MDLTMPPAVLEANDLLEKGDFDGAIRVFQRTLRSQPDSFAARVRLAAAYGRKGRHARDAMFDRLAEREFGEAVRTVPPQRPHHDLLVSTAAELGRAEWLKAHYEGPWSGLPFARECAAALAEAASASAGTGRRLALTPAAVLFWGVLAAAGGLAAWQVVGAMREGGGLRALTAPSDPAPAFALKDLSNQTVTLAQFQGKAIVVLDFWATWCGPCKASLPALHNLRKKYRGKGVEILNVNVQEEATTVSEYLDRERLDLWVLMDSIAQVSNLYRVRGIPTLVVIDKRGGLRERFVGYRADLEDRLEGVIRELM